MEKPDDPIARAFELARGGKSASVADIKKQLKSEGYSLNTLDSPTLARQLRALIKEARKS